MERKKFYVIGIPDNPGRMEEKEVVEAIGDHLIFSGGKRHYELVRDFLPEGHVWINIAVPLETVFEQYKAYPEIVVFASGDPLFFGFANTLKKHMPEAEIQVFPYFNSLQILAHRMLMPYQDMHIVSLTGRPWLEFDRSLIEGHEKIGVLTDRQHTPAAIAGRMLTYGYSNYSMTVGELLGNSGERIRTMELKQALQEEFLFPNNLILERLTVRKRPFGIPETEFCLLNGRTKMITKMPVRLLVLSLLELHNRRSLWDIGFCTGSVSVEAKLQFPHLQITAFEQRPEGEALMEQNCRKFGTPGITAVTGDFTALDLNGFATPDAAFIGGHGGKLERILEILSAVLEKDGIVVFNSVSQESLEAFERYAPVHRFRIVNAIRMAVDDHNPITVIKAVRAG